MKRGDLEKTFCSLRRILAELISVGLLTAGRRLVSGWMVMVGWR